MLLTWVCQKSPSYRKLTSLSDVNFGSQITAISQYLPFSKFLEKGKNFEKGKPSRKYKFMFLVEIVRLA